ncbi:hypothetical protein [uncultured Winogradskyella sp.]|uniref:hypothetical protein n=1 Tax=uncultured Winogradskyella sp. TaxID=395353 RepID=UPI00263155EE|nr:hypothetical protein [uncultured Winogradskyella sp.]
MKKRLLNKTANNFSLAELNTFDLEANTGAIQNYRGLMVSPSGNILIAQSYAGLEQFNRFVFDTPNDLNSNFTFVDDGKWNNTPYTVGATKDGVYGINFDLGRTIHLKTLGANYDFKNATNHVTYTPAVKFSDAALYHRCFEWSTDNRTMYILPIQPLNQLHVYTMPNAVDIQNMVLSTTYNFPAEIGATVVAFSFVKNGDAILLATGTGKLFLFNLSTKYVLSSYNNSNYKELPIIDDLYTFSITADESYLYALKNQTIHQYQLKI